MCTNFSLYFSVSSPRYLWQQLQLVRPAPPRPRPRSNLFYFRAEPRISLCSKVSLWNMGTRWHSRWALCWDIAQRRFLITCLRFGDNLSAPSSWTIMPVKMGPIGCPETSVRDYHYTLSNIAEERRSHLQLGRSLTSDQLVQASATVTDLLNECVL